MKYAHNKVLHWIAKANHFNHSCSNIAFFIIILGESGFA